MALKNFMKGGVYVRIERVDYSKQGYKISGNIAIYEDDTATNKLFETQVTLNASGGNYANVDRIITTEDDLLLEAPEFIDILNGENVLIELDKKAKSDYAEDMDGTIISKTDDVLSFSKYQHIKKPDGIFYTKEDDVYTVLTDVVIPEQFEEIISPTNIIESLYNYMKTLPAYSDCIDA